MIGHAGAMGPGPGPGMETIQDRQRRFRQGWSIDNPEDRGLIIYRWLPMPAGSVDAQLDPPAPSARAAIIQRPRRFP